MNRHSGNKRNPQGCGLKIKMRKTGSAVPAASRVPTHLHIGITLAQLVQHLAEPLFSGRLQLCPGNPPEIVVLLVSRRAL